MADQKPFWSPATIVAVVASAGIVLAGNPALAWGDLGHEVVALIAYRHLTPATKAKVDALLASDADSLTAKDVASRATWADKYRASHRETTAWHFVDLEIDQTDLAAACSGFPASSPHGASQGPAQDCVVDKIEEFAAPSSANYLQDDAGPEDRQARHQNQICPARTAQGDGQDRLCSPSELSCHVRDPLWPGRAKSSVPRSLAFCL